MWWHALITRPMSCSTSRIARPDSASSSRSSEKSAVSDSLRPDDGSSSSTTRGFVANARAISTSRCVPVDRRSTRSSATDVSPMRSISSSASTPGLNFSRDQPLRISAATRTLSRTLSVPNVSSRWNVRPIPSRARWCGFVVVMSLPSSTTVPPVGGCSPVITLKSVVLPAPLGPMRPVTSFSGTSMVTAARAWRPPKRTETESTLRSATARNLPEVASGSSGRAEFRGRGVSRRTRRRPRPARRCCTRSPRRRRCTRRSGCSRGDRVRPSRPLPSGPTTCRPAR